MERRQAPRVPSSNFLGYVCLDEDGVEIGEGYGYTVNLSRLGLRVETPQPIQSPVILLLLIGLLDQILEIKAEVVYCHRLKGKLKGKRYVHGIRLLAAYHTKDAIIAEFIKCSNHRDRAMLRGMVREEIEAEAGRPVPGSGFPDAVQAGIGGARSQGRPDGSPKASKELKERRAPEEGRLHGAVAPAGRQPARRRSAGEGPG
jgi:hypothetical protein